MRTARILLLRIRIWYRRPGVSCKSQLTEWTRGFLLTQVSRTALDWWPRLIATGWTTCPLSAFLFVVFFFLIACGRNGQLPAIDTHNVNWGWWTHAMEMRAAFCDVFFRYSFCESTQSHVIVRVGELHTFRSTKHDWFQLSEWSRIIIFEDQEKIKSTKRAQRDCIVMKMNSESGSKNSEADARRLCVNNTKEHDGSFKWIENTVIMWCDRCHSNQTAIQYFWMETFVVSISVRIYDFVIMRDTE